MTMQVKIASAIEVSSFPHVRADSRSSRSLELESFCQLQVEQLTARCPIFLGRIVYHDPIMRAHQEVMSYAQTQSLSQEALAYLQAEEWLVDFYPAFTLNELSLDCFRSICYICPLGYKSQKPEYILVLATNLSLQIYNST